MNRLTHFYEPHLTIRNVSVPPGKEWMPESAGWSLVQVEKGSGYWMAQSGAELETGMVLLIGRTGRGRIRSSRLTGLSLRSFNVYPDRLTGLLAFSEQDFFKNAIASSHLAFQILPAHDPIALKMHDLCANHPNRGLSSRLALLQLFVDTFGNALEKPAAIHHKRPDAKARLKAFLKDSPPDTLLHISFAELSRKTRCTPRHLNRIFSEVMGMSFRDKRAEIQLKRACELLASSKSKVVDVALESGYHSLSLFYQMFSRRFGISPGQWRQKHGSNPDDKNIPPRRDRVYRNETTVC
ncbi:MAG TPA: AraC family transcriptional regulator [Verrucomicrobiae bacterium]|nr:AraC family transcriptional regulator [Verrucomicrobiae bacterium]